MYVMESVAWAQSTGGSGSGSGTLLSLVPFVLIFVIFYFMLILPQQKAKTAKGDDGGVEEGGQGDHRLGSGARSPISERTP